MKRLWLGVSVVLVTALLITASVTFAFYVHRGADTDLTFDSESPQSSVELTVDRTIGELLPPISQSDNSFTSAGERPIARMSVSFKAADGTTPTRLRAVVAQVNVAQIADPANRLQNDLEFAYAILRYVAGDDAANAETLRNAEPPSDAAAWVEEGTIVEVAALNDADGVPQTGMLAIFFRFKEGVTHELVDPRYHGLVPKLQLAADTVSDDGQS